MDREYLGLGGSYIIRDYVRLEDISPWNSGNLDVDISFLQKGMTVLGTTTGISGIITNSIGKEETLTQGIYDPPTIYVVYKTVAIDGSTSNFIPGEILNIFDSNGINIYSIKVRCPGCPGSTLTDTISVTGKGNIFVIQEGIFYFEGMFIENSSQELIVFKYGDIEDCKIGFNFIQEIITSETDLLLFDNALGYPNSSAPGADRYKITLSLIKKSIQDKSSEDFILLAVIENSEFTYLKTDSEYSNIMDMIAKRTYETNGNFTVTPFKVRFIEEKASDIYDDSGYSISGDPNFVRCVVKGGISYVQGYRFQNFNEKFLRAEKAHDTKKISPYIKRFEERTSINLIPSKGYSIYPNDAMKSNVIDGTIINIYDQPFDGGMNPQGSIIRTV